VIEHSRHAGLVLIVGRSYSRWQWFPTAVCRYEAVKS